MQSIETGRYFSLLFKMSNDWVQLQAEEIEALSSIFDEKQWKRDETDEQRRYILTMSQPPERAISMEITFVDGYPTNESPIYNIR